MYSSNDLLGHGTGTSLKLKKNDSFIHFSRNRIVLIHVSVIRMYSKKKANALFSAKPIWLDFIAKLCSQYHGKLYISSINISWERRYKNKTIQVAAKTSVISSC